MIFYTDRLIPKLAAGCARGPFIFIRPQYRGDAGLLAHEKVHVRQFWRTLGTHGLWYLLSKAYRHNAECEAYARQVKLGLSLERAARFVANRYNLGPKYTRFHAQAMIKHYLQELEK